MTNPTQPDAELREKLWELLPVNRCYSDPEVWCENCIESLDNLVTLFRTYSEAREREPVTGETSDGYHTFNELYDYRRVYNAALFNEWAKNGAYQVHKSWKHSDGELCFGGGWFVVVAQLPTGQITNHYQAEYWDDFDIPEKPKAAEYDGHTPEEALNRLAQLQAFKPEKRKEKV